MQLYDSLTRSEAGAAARRPGRSACTSAARRSTSASTSATRGRTSSSSGCGTGCASRATTSTLVENVTDVNDKIYDAARAEGIPSAELAERATRWYFEDTDGLGIGRPDVEPLATETIPEIVALIEELVERGLAYESQGDVYFRVGRVPRVRRALGREPRRHGRPGAERPEGGPARLRALEGEQAARGHVVGLALGPRPPRLAHRVLGDGGEAPGAGVRAPRRRARPALPAPRERDRPVARGRPAVRAAVGAQRHARVRRGEDVQVARQHRLAPRGARRWGREAILLLFLGAHYRSPVDFSEEAMEEAQAQWEDFRTAFRVAASGGDAPSWDEFAAALDDDFNTPAALAILHEWRAAGRLRAPRAGLAIFGLEVGGRGRGAGRGASGSPRQRRRPARRATSTRPTGCGRRSTPPAGRCRTWPTASA